MDYTFKNSLSEKACTILLTDYCLTIQSAGKEEDIPYANIMTVRLIKLNRKTYKTVLYPDNHDPIQVTNFYHLSAKEVEDRSRQYATFIRVLHLHMKEKSSAVFTSGLNMNTLLGVGISTVLISMAIFVVVHYFAPELINMFYAGMGAALVVIALIFLMQKTKLPKYYYPSEIPLEFLP